MSADSSVEGAVELAARRLERAVATLEQRLAQRVTQARDGAGADFDADRARLAAALDEARARERELEEAGAAASAALSRAIDEVRAALGDGAFDGGAPADGVVSDGALGEGAA